MKPTQQAEKKQAFKAVNWQAWAELYSIRKEYADFRPRSEGAAEEVIVACIRPSTRDYLTRIENHQAEAKKILRYIREVLASEFVLTDPPRPTICVRMITEQVLSFTVDRVIERYAHPPTFVLWYDVASGIMEVIGSLSFAVQPKEAMRPLLMKLTHTAQREYGTVAIPPNIQQTSDARWKEEITEAAQALKDDPSGFTLTDTIIAELHAQAHGKPIKQRLRIEPHQIPEFVIAGAEQAQAIYKTLYPLTEDL
jgi:hypothetical protein